MAMMLNELTWTYWASISAARAPNGLFGPNSFSFVAPFWVKFYFQPNIGMWGVQSVAMERPAHTALFQSIWNHPAEKNGQNVNLGSWGGSSFCGLPSPLPLLVAAIICAPANYRVVHLVIFANMVVRGNL